MNLYGGKVTEMLLKQEAAMAHARLSRHPQLQAEAIVKHYLGHLMIAKQLEKAMEISRYDRSADALAFIDYEITFIKTSHLYDLGIPLEWPECKMGA